MNWLFNTCGQHRQEITLMALDRAGHAEGAFRASEMKPSGRAERHLAKCPRCQAHFKELVSIASGMQSLAEHLPQVTPSAAMTRKWQSAVRCNPREQSAPRATLPFAKWLASPSQAWCALAGIWILVLFFRLSGPELPKPPVEAGRSSSRELLLVFKTEILPQAKFLRAARTLNTPLPILAPPFQRDSRRGTAASTFLA